MKPHTWICTIQMENGGFCACPPGPVNPITPPHEEGFGEVTFYRIDGKTVVIDNLNINGIGPDVDTHGVVSATDINDNVYHLPFISHWTVDYRF